MAIANVYGWNFIEKVEPLNLPLWEQLINYFLFLISMWNIQMSDFEIIKHGQNTTYPFFSQK